MDSISRKKTIGFSIITYFLIPVVFVVILNISNSEAGLYSWKDNNGVTHFSDDPPAEQQMMKDDFKLTEIIKSRINSIPIFIVSNAVDSEFEFSGSYYAIQPSNEGFPQYKLKKKNKNDYSDHTLIAMTNQGKWQWVFMRNDREKYFSDMVDEGTPPSRIRNWTDKLSRWGKLVPINVQKKIITLRTKKLDYIYYFKPGEIPPDQCPWMESKYQIKGLPLSRYNGVYSPVKWSSPLARFTKGNNIILKVENIGEEWIWKILDGQEAKFSSDRVNKGVYPQEVKKWYEIRGRLYVSVIVTEIPSGRSSLPL